MANRRIICRPFGAGSAQPASRDPWLRYGLQNAAPAGAVGRGRRETVEHNKGFLHETNPNSIENKGTLEERTQTNPTHEAGIYVERIDLMEDNENFGATPERCRKQMR